MKLQAPALDKSKREDGTLSRAAFTWDEERDLYICASGKTLRTTGKVHDGRTRLYRSSKHDRNPCPLKQRCCRKAPHRKIPRDIYEDARDVTTGSCSPPPPRA